MLQVMPISGPGWQLPLCMGWQSGIYLAVLLPLPPPPLLLISGTANV